MGEAISLWRSSVFGLAASRLVGTSSRKTLVVVTAAALVAGGVLFGLQLSARAQPQAEGIDHFLCYSATSAIPAPSKVSLQNEFDPFGFTVAPTPVIAHCNPVQKTANGAVSPITNPIAHLLCWSITVTGEKVLLVMVANQFGTAELTTSQPDSLCLPSWKSLTGPPGRPIVQPPGLDHFTCYSVSYTAKTPPFKQIPSSVTLQDQFGMLRTKVGKPTQLCLPTAKTVNPTVPPTPITNPRARLVCFSIKAKMKPPKVYDQNQFGTGQVSLTKVNSLCLPSEMEVIGTPPPTTTTSTTVPRTTTTTKG